nr:LRR receptor-like serine/threonine-protein kinase IOS1 [Arachis hypogaea]
MAVDAITNIKLAYRVTRNWLGDPCGPEAYKWDGLDCNFDGDGIPRITSMNLSTSGLTGHIVPDLLKLTMLKSLDLSNNNLTGDVPYFLAQLQSLQNLNLENNNLSGSIPNELFQKQRDGILSLRVGQNPNLCASTSCNQQTNDTKKKKHNAVIIVLASIAGILLLLVIAAVITFYQSKYYDVDKSIILGKPRNSIKGSELELKQRQYSFNEVVKITNSFDRILGRGGFGTVKLLMRVHHRSLTSLIGYCNEETNIGLIYEYMANNGNLNEYLSGNNKEKSLNWEDRLRITLDAAQGLEYLHNGCKPPIIHRDVKCTNILLDENFHAKLADFGLSKCFAVDGDTHVSTIVAGTPGYLDPEYTTSNRLTEKSDVYSFGVVLLRIITGQPVIIGREDMTHHISQWVNSMVAKGDITKIVDSRLQGDFDSNSAWRAVEIAMASVSAISMERPYMTDIVKELKECLAAELARKHNSCDIQNEDLVGHLGR